MNRYTGKGASAFLYTPSRNVYLAKRIADNRPFFGMYSGPGGTVEHGEDPQIGIAREVQEETSLVIDPSRFQLVQTSGPHITPVEEHGSGEPYSVYWYGVELRLHEVPKVTEPTKQGEWLLWSWDKLPAMTPGAYDALFKLFFVTLRKKAS